MRPFSSSDGSDAPGLIDEVVPGGAAVSDDVVVAGEDAVREMVVAQELPDVLDRVQLGRAGRQRQERDVAWHVERPGEMPSGLVEQEDGMGAARHHGADLGKMRLHGFGVAERHDEPGALALGRTNRPEEIGPGGALVMRRAGPGPAPGPSAGQLVLLADTGFILPPELYAFARMGGPDLRQALRETFLKASAASGSCA
jgi:hypothetical protein